MTLILSIICLAGFVYWIWKIYFTPFDNQRIFRIDKNDSRLFIMSKEMYFVIFTVCTAPFFLTSLSLAKYGLWFLVLCLLILYKRITPRWEIITLSYSLFFCWLFISFLTSPAKYEGFLLLIKYFIPLLFLWLGYSAIDDEYSLFIFLKRVFVAIIVYAFLIGGFSAQFMPWLYFSPVGAVFLKYAGFADYLTSLYVIPLILFWITKKAIYLWGALWLLLSTILEAVRTGLGGMFMVMVFTSFLWYKIKSIPYIAIAVLVALAVVLYVPEVNRKFFMDKAGKVTSTDIIEKDAMSLDKIGTSGRTAMWEAILTKFHKPRPYTGSGLGIAMKQMKTWNETKGMEALMHNDYVQILSETGYIGIFMIGVFYLVLLLKAGAYIFSPSSSSRVKISGIMAVSSMAGIAFSMGFDNVVSHSMTSLIMPFIFTGFFLKFVDLEIVL